MIESDYERRPGMNFTGCRRVVVNILTVLVILTTVVVAVAIVAIFVNPQMSINPFPPPTALPTLGSPTPTQTPAKPLPPAWTPTQTEDANAQPESTPTPTEAPELPTATATVEEEFPFALQVGSPARIENFINGSGCDYMGVFGQVFNMSNEPILELTVHLGGELEGVGEIDLIALTGSELDAGPGGYLFDVANSPIASGDTLWIQIEDGDGNPLSEQIYLETSDSCNENLIMVNWRQVRE